MSGWHEVPVHPNSMAARKWKRSTWRTTSNLFAAAAEARKQGKHEAANAAVARAMRERKTQLHCG